MKTLDNSKAAELTASRNPLEVGAYLVARARGLVRKYVRRGWVVARILPPFFKVLFTRRGLFGRDGRQLIAGKARRSFLSLFPGYVQKLQARYQISGGCVSCGASCNLLFQCPHWNEANHLCSVYEDRPDICRQFPVTPADISDRNLVLRDKPCGFQFRKPSN